MVEVEAGETVEVLTCGNSIGISRETHDADN